MSDLQGASSAATPPPTLLTSWPDPAAASPAPAQLAYASRGVSLQMRVEAPGAKLEAARWRVAWTLASPAGGELLGGGEIGLASTDAAVALAVPVGGAALHGASRLGALRVALTSVRSGVATDEHTVLLTKPAPMEVRAERRGGARAPRPETDEFVLASFRAVWERG